MNNPDTWKIPLLSADTSKVVHQKAKQIVTILKAQLPISGAKPPTDVPTVIVEKTPEEVEAGKASTSTYEHRSRRNKKGLSEKYNPNEYCHAEKRLKKALLEHYRGLE